MPVSSIEERFEALLRRKTIHGELQAADRAFNLLSSRSFYGESDSNLRTMGGIYGEYGLGSYRASPEILSELASKSEEGDEEAAIVAAIVEAIGVSIPQVIYDRFSKKFWESLSRIREVRRDQDDITRMVSVALSVSPKKARRIISKNWPWVRNLLAMFGDNKIEEGEDSDE